MRLFVTALACLLSISLSAQSISANGKIDWSLYDHVMIISQSKRLNYISSSIYSKCNLHGLQIVNDQYNCNEWVNLLTNTPSDTRGTELFNHFVYNSTSTVYIEISNQSLDGIIDNDQITFRFYDCTTREKDILYNPFYSITLKSDNGFLNLNQIDISSILNLLESDLKKRSFSKINSINRCSKKLYSICYWTNGFEVVDVYSVWDKKHEDLLNWYNTLGAHDQMENNVSGVANQINYNQNKDIRVRVSDQNFLISKVAVIGKESSLCDGSKDDGQGLAELVEGELLGIYGVVERRHLEEILDEQRLAMSGLLFEDSDFANAGCLAGAQGTVLVSYGCLQGKTKLQIKLVDCSTSDLYWSATGFDVSEFELLDALRIELNNNNNTVSEPINNMDTSKEYSQIDTPKTETNLQEQNIDIQLQNENQVQDEIRSLIKGDKIEFYLNGDRFNLLVGEIIKVMDNGKIAVSYIDKKGKLKRDYIKVDDIIK